VKLEAARAKQAPAGRGSSGEGQAGVQSAPRAPPTATGAPVLKALPPGIAKKPKGVPPREEKQAILAGRRMAPAGAAGPVGVVGADAGRRLVEIGAWQWVVDVDNGRIRGRKTRVGGEGATGVGDTTMGAGLQPPRHPREGGAGGGGGEDTEVALEATSRERAPAASGSAAVREVVQDPCTGGGGGQARDDSTLLKATQGLRNGAALGGGGAGKGWGKGILVASKEVPTEGVARDEERKEGSGRTLSRPEGIVNKRASGLGGEAGSGRGAPGAQQGGSLRAGAATTGNIVTNSGVSVERHQMLQPLPILGSTSAAAPRAAVAHPPSSQGALRAAAESVRDAGRSYRQPLLQHANPAMLPMQGGGVGVRAGAVGGLLSDAALPDPPLLPSRELFQPLSPRLSPPPRAEVVARAQDLDRLSPLLLPPYHLAPPRAVFQTSAASRGVGPVRVEGVTGSSGPPGSAYREAARRAGGAASAAPEISVGWASLPAHNTPAFDPSRM